MGNMEADHWPCGKHLYNSDTSPECSMWMLWERVTLDAVLHTEILAGCDFLVCPGDAGVMFMQPRDAQSDGVSRSEIVSECKQLTVS